MNPHKVNRWLVVVAALSLAILACSALGGGATEAPPTPKSPTQAGKLPPTATEATPEPTKTPKPTKTPQA